MSDNDQTNQPVKIEPDDQTDRTMTARRTRPSQTDQPGEMKTENDQLTQTISRQTWRTKPSQWRKSESPMTDPLTNDSCGPMMAQLIIEPDGRSPIGQAMTSPAHWQPMKWRQTKPDQLIDQTDPADRRNWQLN